MMSLIVNKKIKQTVLASLLICALPVAQAWVTPVNMDADHEGSGGDFHRLSKTEGGETVNLDRCDTPDNIYESVPTQCHRRNLVWQLGSKNESDVAMPLAQWNPELGGDAWRLPTIKELSRLVDYSGITSDGKGALTGQPLIVNMFSGAFNFQVENAWLISSTYRDIDGDATNGQAQIFGINMGNGEIAAFDTVVSSIPAVAEEVSADAYVFIGNASESRDAGYEFSRTETYQNNMQVVVTEIVTSSIDNNDGTGTFTISGKEHTNKYPLSLEKCTALDTNGVCTTSDVDVYALLVQTQTVSVLFLQP
jgi:hypothetical protein